MQVVEVACSEADRRGVEGVRPRRGGPWRHPIRSGVSRPRGRRRRPSGGRGRASPRRSRSRSPRRRARPAWPARVRDRPFRWPHRAPGSPGRSRRGRLPARASDGADRRSWPYSGGRRPLRCGRTSRVPGAPRACPPGERSPARARRMVRRLPDGRPLAGYLSWERKLTIASNFWGGRFLNDGIGAVGFTRVRAIACRGSREAIFVRFGPGPAFPFSPIL